MTRISDRNDHDFSYPPLHTLRDIGVCYLARAHWHLGEGRLDDAISDILTLKRMSRLLSPEPMLMKRAIAIGLSAYADNAICSLMAHTDPTAEQLRRLIDGRASVPDWVPVQDLLTIEQFNQLVTRAISLA